MLKYNSFDGKPGFVVTIGVIQTHKFFSALFWAANASHQHNHSLIVWPEQL